jgi:hypothetical protein
VAIKYVLAYESDEASKQKGGVGGVEAHGPIAVGATIKRTTPHDVHRHKNKK